MKTKTTSASQNAEKIWLSSYPDGVPAEVDVNAFTSIVDVFRYSIEKFRHNSAIANMGTALTYEELEQKTRDFAAYLQQEAGLRKGDVIAIMMPNILQYPIALFGALRAGLTVSNMNPLYTPREIKYQLVDSGAVCVVAVENFCHNLSLVLPDTQVKKVITTRIGDMLRFPKSAVVNFVVKHVKKMVPPFQLPNAVTLTQALQIGERQKLTPVELNHQDLAFIQYTAGTTGAAKGVMLSHGNIVANIQQTSAWISPFIEEGKEVIITPLPLYHIFSLTANCLLFMKIGALNYLITNPRDFKGFVNELKKIHFTAITGVNTLFNALLNTPGFSEVDFSALHVTIGGGMAVQQAVADRWKSVTGCTLIEAYGLTETSPGACINPINLEQYNGKVGLPISSTECSIQNELGELLPTGETGELCVRGPQVMQGYLNRPEQTAEVLKADGWFHTGDVGYMDEKGFVKILERIDDMILVSGFNVYPNEVESVVVEHPGVLEAAAIGVEDDKSGHVVKLFVVKKDPSLSEKELIEYCKKNLTAYKIPKYVVFKDSLPKSNVGKILRRELR